MTDILLDTFIDTLQLFPFLFATYLILEYLEHKTTNKAATFIKKAGKTGPFIGALVGILPQCGFSVVAANFYAARLISLGTLTAIFLSTSDEMLPIMIADTASPHLIIAVLGYKFLCACIFGYAVYFIYHRHKKTAEQPNIETLCQDEHCHCDEETGILRPALYHALRITVFIFAITLILNMSIGYFTDKEKITYWLRIPLAGEMISALAGLIPNCSASVILTQLYLEGYISIGAMMSGSLSGSGVGLLVLFRVNKHFKQNLKITALLYAFGVLGGLTCNLFDFLQ